LKADSISISIRDVKRISNGWISNPLFARALLGHAPHGPLVDVKLCGVSLFVPVLFVAHNVPPCGLCAASVAHGR